MPRYFLKPFEELGSPDTCSLTCDIERKGAVLCVIFEMTTKMPIRVPTEKPMAGRCDKLWETTCFEVFVGQAGRPPYWEFNFSPSRDWNVYSFSKYREGMKAEAGISDLPLAVAREGKIFRLKTSINLGNIPGLDDEQKALEIGISAVLQESNGKKTYWAIEHNGEKPDFHRRDSFLARV